MAGVALRFALPSSSSWISASVGSIHDAFGLPGESAARFPCGHALQTSSSASICCSTGSRCLLHGEAPSSADGLQYWTRSASAVGESLRLLHDPEILGGASTTSGVQSTTAVSPEPANPQSTGLDDGLTRKQSRADVSAFATGVHLQQPGTAAKTFAAQSSASAETHHRPHRETQLNSSESHDKHDLALREVFS